MDVELTQSAERELQALPPHIRERFMEALDALSDGERLDVKKLKGSRSTWRLRVGDYRGVFERTGGRATFTRFAHRSKVYSP